MQATLLKSLLVMWGCGGKAQPASLPQGEFATTLADTVCNTLDSCCNQGSGSRVLDVPSCLSQYVGLGQELLDEQDTAGTYDGVAAAQCITQVQDLLASCFYMSDYPTRIVEICRGVHQGSSPLGGACTYDQDCAAPRGGTPLCYRRGDSGYCVGNIPSPLGEPCAVSAPNPSDPFVIHTTCVSGLYCDATIHCARTRAFGEACVTEECGDSLYCDPASNTCQPTLPLGSPCVYGPFAYQCAPGYCSVQQVCTREKWCE